MAKKKQADKPHGHFCRICGMHKANEKSSGKGHAAHNCRQCAKLPAAEQAEIQTLRRMEGMMGRYLSENEIQWLRNRIQDSRSAVRQAARELHAVRFPHYARNTAKKGLVLRSLEFYVHGDVWDKWGDEFPVHMRFWLDEFGTARRLDYDIPEGNAKREQIVERGVQKARRFMKQVVHELNAPFWAEDLGDSAISEDEDNDEWDEQLSSWETPAETKQEPLWSLRMVLNKGDERTLTFYHQMHEEPQALYWALLALFESDMEDSPV